MPRIESAHLWVALSPHGYGHAAMTAPVVAELRRRRPRLRVTVQTSLPRHFLATRYGEDVTLVGDIPDFGFRMLSATEIDREASATGYLTLHANFDAVVAAEAARLAAAAPDVVLANVPYVTIAAAARAKIPVAGFSSLNWADMYRHYLGDRPEASRIGGEMLAAYEAGDVFLRVTPAMDMPRFSKMRTIGPVGRRGAGRGAELRAGLGLTADAKVGLIAFGGIDHALPLDRWPMLAGWTWLSTLPVPARDDLRPWEAARMAFVDLLASCDVVVTKPGYGTFTEAALAGRPVLFQPRPDWPESPHLDNWLMAHTRALPTDMEALLDGGLAAQLQRLFSLPDPGVAEPTGVDEAVCVLESMLDGTGAACARS
ncbi:MAG: hypothetical protein ACM31L_18520 [Actinomycetota bacterium]